jgi:uncharacterized protein
MKNTLIILLSAIALNLSTAVGSSYGSVVSVIKKVAFAQIHLNNCFWTPRIEVNRLVLIPSVFKEYGRNVCSDRFTIAAQLMKAEHTGESGE